MKATALVLAAWAAGVTVPAAACGYCVEDKVAAAYDHAVAARARARGHELVYVALEFAQPITANTEDAVRRAVERMPFVDRGSVRVARDAVSLSLAFDPSRMPAGKVLAQIDRSLLPLGATVTLLEMGSPARP
jgi:hypothetical protein